MLYQVNWSLGNISYASIILVLLVFLIWRFPKIENDLKRRIKRSYDVKEVKVKPGAILTNQIAYIIVMIILVIMILAIMQMDWT